MTPTAAAAARVVVVGSANVDLVLSVAALPRAGETVLSDGDSARVCGGKGANQAIAAARAGARAAFVGAVGDDADGALLRATLHRSGVAIDGLRTTDAPTGIAVVTVDAHGENQIVVVPGANALATPLCDAELDAVRTASVLLGQLETPVARFAQAAAVAREHGARVLLNAAPATASLDERLWPLVDVLVVNEHEAAQLDGGGDGGGSGSATAAAQRLLDRVPCVVVTLGAAGAHVARRSAAPTTIAAAGAGPVVDSTGAGDTFCGVLAASLADGLAIEPAIERANAAGALAVERAGAEPSIPLTAAIEQRWREAYAPSLSRPPRPADAGSS